MSPVFLFPNSLKRMASPDTLTLIFRAFYPEESQIGLKMKSCFECIISGKG